MLHFLELETCRDTASHLKLVNQTCWSRKERAETPLGHVTKGCIVVSDCMLISILSVEVEALEILCAEAADALAPRA